MGMAFIYGELIRKKLKTFEDVPVWFRENVYKELVRRGFEAMAIVDGKPYKEVEDKN